MMKAVNRKDLWYVDLWLVITAHVSLHDFVLFRLALIMPLRNRHGPSVCLGVIKSSVRVDDRIGSILACFHFRHSRIFAVIIYSMSLRLSFTILSHES